MIVIGLVAACSANPTLYYYGGAPQYFYGGYYPSAPVVGPPATIKSQYHTQNELGQYAYGYNDGYSSKSETKHANGLTEGSYSYVDPNGVLQQYKYESDENGYRVSGTNLPVAPAVPAVPAVAVAAAPAAAAADLPQPVQDTPEVAAAKVAHRIAYDEAKQAADASPADGDDGSYNDDAVQVSAQAPAAPAAPAPAAVAPAAVAPAVVPLRSSLYGYSTYGLYPSYAYAAPPVAPYAAFAAPVPYGPAHGQYHTQDEYGQYAYGYSSDSSSKSETKTLDGVTRGGYSYVDANGLVQQYHYVSDPVNGFRVAGTNLPTSNHL